MATHHLGEIGVARAPVDMSFSWFGEEIRVGPNAGDLDLIDFLEQAAAIDTGDSVKAMIATRNFLRGQIHEDDWDRFMTVAKANNQQFDDLLQVAKDIVSACARFPTGRLSDSSDGQPTTGPKLRDDSSSVEVAMAMAKGRPDIKMVIWQAQQARAANEAELAAAA